MLVFLFLSLFAATLSSAQTTCIKHTPVQSGPLILRYTPYVTPQVAPTTTVYRSILTTWFKAVDCRYLVVERVDDNEPAIGPWTARTTVDALTITRVGCLEETIMITRRGAEAQPTEVPMHGYVKRDVLQANILATATRQAETIPPDAQSISVRAYGYLVQVNTALFALNLYNTGFNMSATCALLSDPVTQARLLVASVNPSQAAGIICYAAQNGLYFGVSNSQLLSDLLGIIYSIEIKSGFTQNATAICNELQLDAAGFLGIDTQGIRNYICDGQSPAATPSLLPPTSTSNLTSIGGTGVSTVTGTDGVSSTFSPPFANSTVYTSSPASLLPGSGISAAPTWVNHTSASTCTASSLNGTSKTTSHWNGTYATTTISATHAYGTGSAGTGLPSDSYSITFPNTTISMNASIHATGRIPPSPYAQISYGAWTTSTTSALAFPRY